MEKQKVLHILTLLEGRGEYGGPVTVARTIQQASFKSRFELRLLGGTRMSGFSQASSNLSDRVILVRPILKKLNVSSLISLKIIFELFQSINSSQLAHLHFARDLIQIFAGYFCILLRKPFFIQTHGMIRRKDSVLVGLFDRLIIVPILKRARKCFALSEVEARDLREVYPEIRLTILRNGCNFDYLPSPNSLNPNQIDVVFCSRLHKTKGIRHFCELAKAFENNQEFNFIIFGPDGGELNWVEKFISKNSHIHLEYHGSLQPDLVLARLAESDLLILPSSYDPYPMIVLEALSVGTPILINSKCGQANVIDKIDPHFVYEGNDSESLIRAFRTRNAVKVDVETRAHLRNSYREIFGIDTVWETLEGFYDEISKAHTYGK